MEKIRTGIPGLDEVTRGGLHRGGVALVCGDAGAGKTILSMQMLVDGKADSGEGGLFVSFEEPADELAANVRQFGWKVIPVRAAVSPSEPPDAIPVLDARFGPDHMQAGDFDLSGLLAAVTAATARTSAKRVVFDGVDAVLDLLDDPRLRRREIHRIGEWTRASGMTTIITGKALDQGALDNGYGFLRYVASSVIALEMRGGAGNLQRTLQVRKMRGSGHSTAEHPMIIGDDGIVVGDVGQVRLDYEASTERVSSGVTRLDQMLGGGIFRGSSTLISGAPGTAKTTLSGAFLEAACRRGERALLISFDEAYSQIQRNLASVNIQLQPHVESGLLKAAAFRTGRLGPEEHLQQILAEIDAHRPKAVVIDPISALSKLTGEDLAGELAERIIDRAKAQGITMLMTSLLDDPGGTRESTKVQISSIADTWIQLSFTIVAGERNRAVTIIKSRGNAHSNQVRELILSAEGLSLADVYAQGGAVLMGTARIEREQQERLVEEQHRREAETAQEELSWAEDELRGRLKALETELKSLERRRHLMAEAEAVRRSSDDSSRRERLRSRTEVRRRPSPTESQ